MQQVEKPQEFLQLGQMEGADEDQVDRDVMGQQIEAVRTGKKELFARKLVVVPRGFGQQEQEEEDKGVLRII